VVDVQEAREPVAGRDVLLTLNSTLQQHAENLLAEALMDADTQLLKSTDEETAEAAPQPVPVGGCVVVMEVNSGRILAAASAPTFDLALYTVADAEDWEQVNQDQRRPLFSRITGMALPPGSVFKPLTAVAAIENGSLNPAQPFFCQGFLNTPQEHRCLIFRLYGSGHGDITLQEALAQSCNVYFFDAARRMGIGPLIDWSERFEFGQATGIDLPFEVSGSLPAAPAPDANSSSSSRYERQALGLAIGQSRLTVTPLQMVRMMAAIANGGWLVTPHVVSKDGLARTTDDVETASAKIRRVRIPGLHPELLEPVREGLEAVVQQPDGTGYRTVRLDDVAIAGKSGTAETAPGKADHAWFAGYVPANEPQYAFAVVLEHGGSGSKSAGPVARELIRQIKDLQLLE
jgi:penicillin-binding protein 2